MKETEQLEEKEENPVEEGVKTRGQLARKAMEEKRKSAEMNISEGKTVQSSEGPIENNAKKPRTDQEEPKATHEMDKTEEYEIVTFGPKKPDDRMLSAWAWGTGSAEEFQGYDQYEVWEEHDNNETANYLRRKDILKRVGLEFGIMTGRYCRTSSSVPSMARTKGK